jgi:hypothetical protein
MAKLSRYSAAMLALRPLALRMMMLLLNCGMNVVV